MSRMLVLLLAMALAAAGGIGPALARDVGLVRADPVATGHAHAGHEDHGASRTGPLDDCDAAGGRTPHHAGGFCSLCLLARAGVDMAGPGLPPRPLVVRADPWTGPAVIAVREVQTRAPTARGPPFPVI